MYGLNLRVTKSTYRTDKALCKHINMTVKYSGYMVEAC